jgi:hypothetical protein
MMGRENPSSELLTLDPKLVLQSCVTSVPFSATCSIGFLLILLNVIKMFFKLLF